MGFIQIIEYTTTRKDEIDKLFDEWLEATKGKRTATRFVLAQDRDKPNRYVEIVSFPSYDEAMKNSNLPETQQISEQFGKLTESGLTFQNLDVIREENV